MRGENQTEQTELYSYITIEIRIPAKHSLRKIKEIIDSALEVMNKEINALYSAYRIQNNAKEQKPAQR